jgi:N-acetylmuramoyl-L-alanine amidase
MATKKIYINRGHSDNDPGAIGYETERKLIVKVGDYMESYLKANYKCYIKSSPGSVDSLTTISNAANNWGADLTVSIHFNAFKKNTGDGAEFLVYGSNRKDLGEMFEKYVVAIGQNSRGVKYRSDLGILRLTNMPCILVECAFVDTWKDIKDWNDNAELKKMGEALAKAAADYLNLPLKKKGLVDCKDFKVEVVVKSLKIRKGPGSTHKQIGTIKKGEIYTIVKKTADGKWGLLKAGPVKGSSYINLSTKYVKKV